MAVAFKKPEVIAKYRKRVIDLVNYQQEVNGLPVSAVDLSRRYNKTFHVAGFTWADFIDDMVTEGLIHTIQMPGTLKTYYFTDTASEIVKSNIMKIYKRCYQQALDNMIMDEADGEIKDHIKSQLLSLRKLRDWNKKGQDD